MSAKELAQAKHTGQMYGDKPYTYHLEQVVAKCEALYGDSPIIRDVAWLHDILEDTDCTLELLPLAMMETHPSDANINRIVKAVDAITHRPNEPRDVYITRCMANPLAHKVKIADTMCNLTESIKNGHIKRCVKYSRQLVILTEAIAA